MVVDIRFEPYTHTYRVYKDNVLMGYVYQPTTSYKWMAHAWDGHQRRFVHVLPDTPTGYLHDTREAAESAVRSYIGGQDA